MTNRFLLFLFSALIFLIGFPASATRSPGQLGPFKLGMTAAQFRRAAERAGFVRPKLQIPQERDIMGLGLMEVQPITTESRELQPAPGKIWQATAYLLSGRAVYINIDYGLEDPERARRWFDEYDAPANARNALIDSAWTISGVVMYTDRFGGSLHAVAYGGLRRSDRVLVTVEGAVIQANEYFRRIRARQAEASLELIRQRVLSYYGQRRQAEEGTACVPPVTVAPTPGETACDLEAKRFPAASPRWNTPTWAALGIHPTSLSRFYSFSIESDGTNIGSRIVLVANGDLDCDGDVATLRVSMRHNPRAEPGVCSLTEGRWDVINPFE